MVARKRDPNAFGLLLAEFLARARMSESAFAKQAGIPPQTLNMMRHKPPTKELPNAAKVAAWSVILGLSAAEAKELRLQLALSSTPQVVQEAMVEARAALAEAGAAGPKPKAKPTR